MGEGRFDALVRRVGVAGASSRRAVSVGLLAMLLPGRASAAPVTAEACRRFKEKCKRKNECCSGKCRRKNSGKRRCTCSPEGARCVETGDCCADTRPLYCASGFCVRRR